MIVVEKDDRLQFPFLRRGTVPIAAHGYRLRTAGPGCGLRTSGRRCWGKLLLNLTRRRDIPLIDQGRGGLAFLIKRRQDIPRIFRGIAFSIADRWKFAEQIRLNHFF